MLCVLLVFDGGSGKLIIVQVSFLVLGEVLGFGKSRHVCGEDNASRIAQDSGLSHFVVDWCPTVGCIGWLRPYDVVSLILKACGEEGFWFIDFASGEHCKGMGA